MSAAGAAWSVRGFRWLALGSVLSNLGEQFTLLALPWLVLKVSGDPLQLGTTLACMSVPRAVLGLLGGALVDRHPPRQVLLLTKACCFVLLAVLAAIVAGGQVRLWVVDLFAAAIGAASAFSLPASTALLPRVLAPAALASGNGILLGLAQASLLFGPLAAGALLRAFGAAAGGAGNVQGLWAAFAVDSASFALSGLALLGVRKLAPVVAARFVSLGHGVLQAARELWRDRPLRTVGLYYAAIAFFVSGPIQVALPVLANTRLPGGAADLGVLLAGHGAGSLAGMALSGWKPRWRLGTLGATILWCDGLAGLAFTPFGLIDATWQGLALLVPIGMLAGFVQVAVLTWMQQRVPADMLGRAMSLFIFLFLGIAPLATTVAGAALRVLTPQALFAASGLTLLAIVLGGSLLTSIGDIREA